MVMELHVWGKPEELAIISPNCLIISWYMSLTIPLDKFKIITSSNNNISQNGELPVLRVEGEQYNGVSDIIRYLVDQGYDLNSGLTKEEKALNDGISIFLMDKFNIITDYFIFLNKLNYENYTRSIYGQYLSFPLQYNTPLGYRSQAKSNCSRVGLTVEDKTEVEEEMLQNVPTVSKVQQLKNESLIEDKLIMKNSLTNMKCLNLLDSYIEKLFNLHKELGTSPKTTFFNSLSTADLILLSHLFIQTNDKFPDQFIKKFLDLKYPGWLDGKFNIFNEKIKPMINQIKLESPGFNDSPNLLNFIRYALI
ncbi:Sorting assembly machinery [Wickerhamomyces ciferrii]|uniref:Sorting assembly machinery n=1 Tax=Wickerhamomyces ciferrii (strain ATCC 14091 / BCRC 22168 / CBS 111 / JCM 3599 / NBRC 0793 / NRRL Y-1031 F-60-10) TaxID=1206466 RepID=K0KI29_WICCF|nr:Sorting assembly machinery [Wickerhamomyces ciferrii]CCH44865.1 Sorting assembly machinery [Wickerhamomyces ciferrii]